MRIARGATALSAVLLSLSGCASIAALSGRSASDLPYQLRPPTNESKLLTVEGSGVQIYDCAPKAGQLANYEWTLRAPDAQLKDSAGRVVGRHFAGPTWELDDGSSVVAEMTAQTDSPDKTAIPWLLLTARRTTGSGKLATVGSVLRLHTVGGLAPKEGCDAGNAGKETRVPYSASYEFYGTKP